MTDVAHSGVFIFFQVCQLKINQEEQKLKCILKFHLEELYFLTFKFVLNDHLKNKMFLNQVMELLRRHSDSNLCYSGNFLPHICTDSKVVDITQIERNKAEK